MMLHLCFRDSLAARAAIAVLLVGLCIFVPGPAVHAEVETSETTAQRPADSDTQARIRRSFAELADGDAAVREKARTTLMGMERPDLPLLEKVVAESRPLLPSQTAVLREIVTHVYLAGEFYEANGNFGFLGVRMTSFRLPIDQLIIPGVGVPPNFELLRQQQEENAVPPGDDPPPDKPAPQPRRKRGIVIVHRFVGLAGNLMLRDGDIIVGIADRPEVDVDNDYAFAEAVKETGAGSTVRLSVLRQGRLMRIAVRLGPRPEVADRSAVAVEQFERDRKDKAKRYWQKAFLPLLQDRQVG